MIIKNGLLACAAAAAVLASPLAALPKRADLIVKDKRIEITARCKDGYVITAPVSDWPTICSGRGGTMYPYPYIDPTGGVFDASALPLVDQAVRATAEVPRASPGRKYMQEGASVFTMPAGATAQYYIPGYIKNGYIRCGDGRSILIGNLLPPLHAGMCFNYGGFVGYADYPEPDKVKI